MWLGATLSTLLHVGSIVLFFIGLSVVGLALSTDKKEPETVDTNIQTGARKVEAPAKTKLKNIEVARETAEGKKTEEKPTEDPSQSAPSIDIQIIWATNVPSILQKIIEKPTTAINKSQQPQPDKKKPTPALKPQQTKKRQQRAQLTQLKPSPLQLKKASNRKSVTPPKTQATKRKPSEVKPVTNKPEPPKSNTQKSKPIEF